MLIRPDISQAMLVLYQMHSACKPARSTAASPCSPCESRVASKQHLKSLLFLENTAACQEPVTHVFVAWASTKMTKGPVEIWGF